jgi:hypothetical protein
MTMATATASNGDVNNDKSVIGNKSNNNSSSTDTTSIENSSNNDDDDNEDEQLQHNQHDNMFLGWRVWKQDPTHPIIKSIYIVLTVTSLIIVWNSKYYLVKVICHFHSNSNSNNHDYDYDYDYDYDMCIKEQNDLFDKYDSLMNERYNEDSTNNTSIMIIAMMMLRLLETSMGVPFQLSKQIILVSIITYVSLIVLDIMLGTTTTTTKVEGERKENNKNDSNNNNDNENDYYPYPKSWDTSNEQCYNDMFIEPKRNKRLIKRFGNTISNVTYLITSLLILCSSYLSLISLSPTTTSITMTPTTPILNNNIFVYSDLLFGILIFILSISSTMWHACNAPFIHYFDLWSMDNSIIYLFLRNFGLLLLKSFSSLSPQQHIITPDIILMILYLTIIIISGYNYYYKILYKQNKYLHGRCLFSVHARLSSSSPDGKGKSDVWTKGHYPIRINEICVFASIPALHVVISGIFMIKTATTMTVGSIYAGTITQTTLIIGWSYRMFEKWALNGSPITSCTTTTTTTTTRNSIINGIDNDDTATYAYTTVLWMRIILSAILSPTAILHWMTGITLLSGYIHSRSVEQECCLLVSTSS